MGVEGRGRPVTDGQADSVPGPLPGPSQRRQLTNIPPPHTEVPAHLGSHGGDSIAPLEQVLINPDIKHP